MILSRRLALFVRPPPSLPWQEKPRRATSLWNSVQMKQPSRKPCRIFSTVLAFGCGVVAPEAEPFSGDWMSGQVDFHSRFLDALRLGKAAMQLPWVNREQVTAWGEGFGGGLALAAAALVPGVTRAAALNPMPADLRSMGMDGMDDFRQEARTAGYKARKAMDFSRKECYNYLIDDARC